MDSKKRRAAWQSANVGCKGIDGSKVRPYASGVCLDKVRVYEVDHAPHVLAIASVCLCGTAQG